MSEYVEDREYMQPESDTIDWLVYAEYVSCELRKIGQDVRDAVNGQDRQDG